MDAIAAYLGELVAQTATSHCFAFIKETRWTLTMAVPWWQIHKHCCVYHYYYHYDY